MTGCTKLQNFDKNDNLGQNCVSSNKEKNLLKSSLLYPVFYLQLYKLQIETIKLTLLSVSIGKAHKKQVQAVDDTDWSAVSLYYWSQYQPISEWYQLTQAFKLALENTKKANLWLLKSLILIYDKYRSRIHGLA